MPASTIPELDRRLREARNVITERAEALRSRLRSNLREMAPRRQLRRHPGIVIASAAFAGLAAGLVAGRIASRLYAAFVR